MNEGIYKLVNGEVEKYNTHLLTIDESWKQQRMRLQVECPGAKIKYSYKTKQFTIIYNLPSDFKILSTIQMITSHEEKT